MSNSENRMSRAGLGFAGWMGLLLLLLLVIEMVLARPDLQSRLRRSVPEEFTAPLELQQKHFGLVDDYGIKPKHPKFLTRASRKESEELRQVHKSKRDEPDLEEYYNDDLF